MSNIEKLLNEAETLQDNGEWELIPKYLKDANYSDDDGIVNISGKTIDTIKENVSVQGEQNSQYIEFVMDRFFDGVDLASYTIAIHYETNGGGGEDNPVNVYKNDSQIKFGWVIGPTITQQATSVQFCIWVRGTLSDGKTYVWKTLPQTYPIKQGLVIGGGIPEPDQNWFLQFSLNMDEKVAQALQSANEAKDAELVASQAQEDITQKAVTIDTQYEEIQTSHNEVKAMHKESQQFRNEAEQFRNQAESFTPDGYSNLIEQVDENTDEIEEINDSINSGFKKVESGEDIHITDSADASIPEFHLFGKSKQNTTSGNQLLDYEGKLLKPEGITVTVNNDKSLTINGTTTSNYSMLFFKANVKLDPGSYYISGGSKTSGNYYAQAQITLSDGKKKYYDNTSFTIDGTEQEITLSIQTGDYAGAINCTIYPMLNKGTTALPIEPYTGGQPSPNPQYPQDIEVPTNPIVNSRGGEQLANLPDAEEYNVSGIKWSCKNGAVTAVGTSSSISPSNMGVIKSKIPIEAGTYFVSGSVGKVRVFVMVKPAEGSTSYYSEQFFKLKGDEQSASLYCQIDNGNTVNETIYPMLNKGNTALPFEQYKETESTIKGEYAGIPVSDVGNYTDDNGQQWICDEVIKYADRSGEKIQRVNKYKVTSNSTFMGYKSLGSYARCTINGKDMNTTDNAKLKAFSNIFPNLADYTSDKLHFYVDHAGIYVFVPIEELDTQDEYGVKSWLISKNAEFLYVLKEPIHTPLTAEEVSEIEKLHTFSPITNISNNADCGMQVTYYTVKEADMLNQSYYTSKKNEKDISVIQKELRETTFKVDTIIDKADLGIKNTASGEEIHTTDSDNAKVREFALYGKAKQNTTQGNQLFHFKDGLNLSFSGMTMKDNGDGTLYVNGTSTKADGMTVLGNGFVGTEVVLSLKAGTYSVSGLPSGLMFYMYKTNTASAESINITSNRAFTLEEDTDFTSISLRWQIDKTFNSPVTKIMLNKGTTPLPWEPYTGGQPSPSPEYPQEIEVPNGNVVVNSCGKNTLNPKNYKIGNLDNDTGEETTGDLTISKEYATILPNTKYSLSHLYPYGVRVSFYNENKVYISNYFVSKKGTFTTPTNAKYYKLKGSTSTIFSVAEVQLELGDESTEYEPYKETTATIPVTDFAGIKVSEGGNYTDSNGQQWISNEIWKYADGSGEKIQRVGKYILDGSADEGWYANDTGGATRFIGSILVGKILPPRDGSIAGKLISNSFKLTTANNTYLGRKIGIAVEVSGAISVYDGVSTNVEEFKEYLTNNNVTLYYELTEPIHTPLTAEEIAEIEKLSTFYPVTNISNDFDCGMNVTYLADSKLYIDNKLAQIAAAMVNNI